MKVTKEKVGNNQAFLTIEMETAEVEVALEKSYRRLVKKTDVPGFRKGKAPRDMLERHLGKDYLFNDAVNHLLSQVYEEALKEAEIEAFAQARVEVAQTDPVVFKAVVPLPPVIKLGDYHKIRVTPDPVEVADADIDVIIGQLRHQCAVWEPVGQPIGIDDLAILDIKSEVEGKPFIEREGFQYQVIKNQTYPLPGFSEQLQGMKKGEEKEFRLKFPSDDRRKELAEKEAAFKVKVVEIKKERLPEVNDDFAQQVNPDFKTLDALREQILSYLRAEAEERAKVAYEGRVVEAMVKLSQVEFPPILTEIETNRMLEQESQRLRVMGNAGLDEYLKKINRTEADLREELHPQAVMGVTQALVLAKLAEEEKIEIGESEIDAEIEDRIENLTKSASGDKDKLRKALNNPRSRHSVRQYLITRKTIQRLVEMAEGNVKTRQKEGKSE